MYYHQLLASIPTGCLPTTSDNISEAKTRSSNKACENISGAVTRRKSKACIATQHKAKRKQEEKAKLALQRNIKRREKR